jgi:hypothetical protein
VRGTIALPASRVHSSFTEPSTPGTPRISASAVRTCAATAPARIVIIRGCFFTRDTTSGGSSL